MQHTELGITDRLMIAILLRAYQPIRKEYSNGRMFYYFGKAQVDELSEKLATPEMAELNEVRKNMKMLQSEYALLKKSNGEIKK